MREREVGDEKADIQNQISWNHDRRSLAKHTIKLSWDESSRKRFRLISRNIPFAVGVSLRKGKG